jgi:hypothetical protein
MHYKIYLNLLWFVPLIVWFVTRNKPQIFASTITAISFGLVVPYASAGLHYLHFEGMEIEMLGTIKNFFVLIHHYAGYKIADTLNLIARDTAITNSDRVLLQVINTVFWVINYGILGYLWGYFSNKRRK